MVAGSECGRASTLEMTGMRGVLQGVHRVSPQPSICAHGSNPWCCIVQQRLSWVHA
jgi:hypothetical protein